MAEEEGLGARAQQAWVSPGTIAASGEEGGVLPPRRARRLRPRGPTIVVTLIIGAGLTVGLVLIVLANRTPHYRNAVQLAESHGPRATVAKFRSLVLTTDEANLLKNPGGSAAQATWFVFETREERSGNPIACLPQVEPPIVGFYSHLVLATYDGGIHAGVEDRLSHYSSPSVAQQAIDLRTASSFTPCFLDGLGADLLTLTDGGSVSRAVVTARSATGAANHHTVTIVTQENYTVPTGGCTEYRTDRWQQVDSDVIDTSFEACNAAFPADQVASLNALLEQRVDGPGPAAAAKPAH